MDFGKTDTAKAYQGIELNVQILKVAENCRYLDNTIDVGGCAVDSVSVRTDEVVSEFIIFDNTALPFEEKRRSHSVCVCSIM